MTVLTIKKPTKRHNFHPQEWLPLIHLLRQLLTNALYIRGDSLKTIANNEFSVLSHQYSVSFFKTITD